MTFGRYSHLNVDFFFTFSVKIFKVFNGIALRWINLLPKFMISWEEIRLFPFTALGNAILSHVYVKSLKEVMAVNRFDKFVKSPTWISSPSKPVFSQSTGFMWLHFVNSSLAHMFWRTVRMDLVCAKPLWSPCSCVRGVVRFESLRHKSGSLMRVNTDSSICTNDFSYSRVNSHPPSFYWPLPKSRPVHTK